jgi:hypothetical protein
MTGLRCSRLPDRRHGGDATAHRNPEPYQECPQPARRGVVRLMLAVREASCGMPAQADLRPAWHPPDNASWAAIAAKLPHLVPPEELLSVVQEMSRSSSRWRPEPWRRESLGSSSPRCLTRTRTTNQGGTHAQGGMDR